MIIWWLFWCHLDQAWCPKGIFRVSLKCLFVFEVSLFLLWSELISAAHTNLNIWWSYGGHMMVIWWSYDDHMIILWWSYDDHIMIIWWSFWCHLDQAWCPKENLKVSLKCFFVFEVSLFLSWNELINPKPKTLNPKP